jgi:hypothetical protein
VRSPLVRTRAVALLGCDRRSTAAFRMAQTPVQPLNAKAVVVLIEEGKIDPSIVVATFGAVLLLQSLAASGSAASGPERAQRRHLFAAVSIPIFGLQGGQNDVWQLQDHSGWAGGIVGAA